MTKLRVLMLPTLRQFEGHESGIKRVIEAYHKYAKNIVYVDCGVEEEHNYDVFSIHAGTSGVYPVSTPIVSILHGLYWTADYQSAVWEFKANRDVIESIRRATLVTVPSPWVAKNIARDARISPTVVPHGIHWEEWVHDFRHENYVLWNKNRNADVCSPEAVGVLADRFSQTSFVSTFAPDDKRRNNIVITGVVEHSDMKKIIQKAAVYLSSTKETFGIGILEALASGVPVLGFAKGGNLDLIQHGVNGFLAKPGDYDSLANGLVYCMENRDILGRNARETAKQWGWENPVEIIESVFISAYEKWKFYQRPLYLPDYA